jgi:Putative auto-transporter adhesin, head GIN domain
MRLRLALALLAVLLLVSACSVTKGSGQVVTETRMVGGFTKVELSGSGELTIEKTGTESLSVSAEDNLLPQLTSDVSGDTLTLGTKPNTSILPTKPITYSLTVKDLTGITVSGSGSVRVSDLMTNSLTTKISGSGTITASGSVNDQDVDISGSGRYQAEQMTSKAVKAQISGSGTASVLATDLLDVKISGDAHLQREPAGHSRDQRLGQVDQEINDPSSTILQPIPRR